ncbi:MAG: HEAT repeat domain-containing protein [Planctomycetes bacterium]|nr:HEAT repeat domain-containing protein [Planctomycetota bacterium]
MHLCKAALLAWFVIGAGLLSLTAGQAPADVDEQILKAGGVPCDNEGLLKFFQLRSLKEGDQELLERLVKQLSSDVYKEREQATKDLLLRGPLALDLLLQAKKDTSLEVQRRVETLIKKIDGVGPELPVSAARLLAARKTPGALETLLNYVPYANDAWIEEEVLACVGRLAINGSKIDPILAAVLKDKISRRRAAAVYVLGRRGEIEARESVREYLNDSDAIVRERAAQALAGKRPFLAYKDSLPGDEALIKSQNYAIDEPALLELLRKRTLGDDDQKRLQKLIVDLGDPVYAVRSKASKLLIKEGTPALAFLKAASNDPEAERARRVQLCIDEIRRGPGPALPAAAIRLLARPTANKEHSPAAAIRVLLGYVPFADDETVEEEVFTALTLLSLRESKVDPLLPEGLSDPMPSRRAAAAHVLGMVGGNDHLTGVRRLLDDPSALVRLRAAHGLLAARDKAGIPALVALLTDAPTAVLWQVEDTLHRLAGEKGPSENIGEGTPEKRQAAAKAWEKWWAANSSTVDLAGLHEGEGYLGLTLVCEYDTAVGQPGGQVWEAGRDGKPRWKIKGVMGAMDAQMLPNGRVLVAENSANRITERDLTGKILWDYRTPGNPIACQRLPNGNTFIATYNSVMEISHDQKQLYNVNRGPQFYIFSAHKMRNGQVVAMTAQGVIHVFDPVGNKEIRTIKTGPNGGWCSVEALPNGRYLVATMGNGQVREIDADGKPHWSVQLPGAFRATRLPNGNTLVASMTSRQVVEFDRAGAKVWEKTCEGRPWSVHFR